MPGIYAHISYPIFRHNSFVRLRRTREAIVKARLLGTEIPSSLIDDINFAEAQYKAAEEKFRCRNNEEAADDMQKVNESADAVSEVAEELYFRACSQKVCEVRNSYRDHKDLAAKYIPDYNIHKENLRDIKKRRERNEMFQWEQACSDNDQLQSFLDAFELVKEELFFAIKEKEEEKKEREEAKKEAKERFRISTILACVVIIIGVATLIATIIFGIIGINGRSDSSQQAAQPGATVSGAENSTQTP